MQNVKTPVVQGAHAGRFLVGWFPSRPRHPVRFYSRDLPISAVARDSVSALDFIEWPEGTRPKRGGVTKASLTRLKIADLKAQLQRLGAEATGTKDQLAEKLLQIILGTSDAAAAGTQAATSTSAASASLPAARLQEQLLQHKQRLASSATAETTAGTASVTRRQTSGAIAEPQQQQQQQQQEEEQQQQQQQEEVQAQSSPISKLRLSRDPVNGHVEDISRQQQQQQPQEQCKDPADTQLQQVDHHLQQQQRQQQEPREPKETGEWRAIQPGRVTPVDPAEAARIAAAAGVQLDDLPPLNDKTRGQVWDVEAMTELTTYEQELALKANRAGLVCTLLGGAYAGAATAGDAAAACLGLCREKDIWLFDCGEDIQRSVLWREHLKPSKMHRIVITRQAPDAMLGLPGMLCVIGASREKGHEVSDIPVHVFAPEGTAELVSTMYECSDTFLEMPVVVHEFVTYAVSDDERQPRPLNKRAKIWRALMPPDQLNPQGWIHGAIDAFMPTQGRARVKKGGRAAGGVLAINPRAGFRPFETPPPGDPTLQGLPLHVMRWSIIADEGAMMTATLVESEPLSWAVVWKEADKQGNLSVPRCTAFNIDSELYKDVKNGEAVQTAAGVTIPAGLLCSPDKPGRKIVLLPACSNADTIAPYAAGADVLYGDVAAAGCSSGTGTGSSGEPSNTRSAPHQQQQPLGLQLGMFAEQCGVRNLVITGLPGDADVSSSTKWRAGGTTNSRPRGSSRDSTSSSNPSDGDQSELAAQQQQQRQDPAVAAVLGIVAEQYTSGHIMPARDDFSLIVEENLGVLPAAPVDVAEKVAAARASTLNVLSITPPSQADRDMQRDLQREKQKRVQEQRQAVKSGVHDRGTGSTGQNGYRNQQQQGYRQQQQGYRHGQQQQPQQQQQRSNQGGNGYRQGQGGRDGQVGDEQKVARVGRDGDRQQQSRTQQQQHWQRRQQLGPVRAADARQPMVTR